jgi:hypothetical protein
MHCDVPLVIELVLHPSQAHCSPVAAVAIAAECRHGDELPVHAFRVAVYTL